MHCGTAARFLSCLLATTFFFAISGMPQTVSAQARKTSDQGNPTLHLPWVRQLGDTHAQGVIVFVHGVLGDARSTWSNGSSYWPELLTRDRTFDGQDIYVYGYRSPKLGESFSIDEVAENLRLVLSTDGVLRYKEITFVSHSMGGLVTRAFLIKYQTQVAPKVRFLYFFATPTTGSPYAALATLVSKNPQFGQMYPMNDSDSYLGPLQSNWLAADLGLKSYCAYETLPMLLGKKIVERDSATNLCNKRLDPIDANHITIVKPADATSTTYRTLKSAFEETRNTPAPGPVGPRNNRKNAPPRARASVVKETLFSTLIPFNDGDGDPIPPYKITQITVAETQGFSSVGLFYKRIADWSKSALEGRDRPKSPEEINTFLKEIIRYHLFDSFDQLQHDRYGFSWDYRTGMKSSVIPANAPPDFIEYPSNKIIQMLSNTLIGTVKDVMKYWRERPTKFRIPSGSAVQFITSPENGADAYRIQISNPSIFTMTLSVLQGTTMLNYGFVPQYFEVTSETSKHIRTFNMVVKCSLELRRSANTDPQVEEQYVKWADGLFDGLSTSIKGPPQPSTKQRTLLLANGVQIFARQRAQVYTDRGILLYPDKAADQQKRRDFDSETVNQFKNRFGVEFNEVVGELASSGLDTTDIGNMAHSIGLPETVLRLSEEMRRLASQIDDRGNLVR